MPTPKFDAIVQKVRDWANRDSGVLTDSLVSDFLDYSADLSYRTLRIPSLEFSFSYPVIIDSSVGDSIIELPPNLTEVLQFKRTDSQGVVHVFDERMDILSFEDKDTIRHQETFMRKGDTLFFFPDAALGDVYTIHHYRRLFDLDAVFLVNQTNLDNGNLTAVNQGDPDAEEFPESSGDFYTGNEVFNWLRDSNERVLLWGALGHALDFLGEDTRADKYRIKQANAIDELNREEQMRKARGGINVVTYTTSDLI